MDALSQPWISVHALSEFTFCPRAGVLAAATSGEEDQDDDHVHLDFLPEYSLVVIEEQLALRIHALTRLAAQFVGVTLLTIVLGVFVGRWLAFPLGAYLLWLGRRAGKEVGAIVRLVESRRQARSAQPKEPPEDVSGAVPVDWWELLKAGFDSIRLQEPYADESTRVAGKPWRVLRKGSLRVPVIKIGEDHYEGGRYWIYPKHEVRLAAYAHLIETCEGGSAPYGVVLFGSRYHGIALPISAEMKALFARKRVAYSELLSSETAQLIAEPTDAAVCLGCPWGRPEPVRPEAVPLGVARVFGRTGNDGRLHHSECGDRFQWTPPHALAKAKRLLPPT